MRSHRKNTFLIILIVILIIALYMILDLWAVKRIDVDLSSRSIINSAANLDFEMSLLKTEANTEITLINPTFIPIFVSSIRYDLSYGDRVFGSGETGVVLILPKSNADVSADFELNHLETGAAAVEKIVNLFQDEKKSFKFSIYANLGPFKTKIY